MLLFIGVGIGLLLGLTGAGGSVFAVPLLVMMGGLSINEAAGVSLGAVVASSFYGSLFNWRAKNIVWLPAIILSVTGAFFAPFGKWFGLHISDTYLVVGFSLLAILIALRMWWRAQTKPQESRVVRASHFAQAEQSELLCSLSKTGQFEWRLRCVLGLFLGGALVGFLSGLFGVGGGFLIVPLLMALSCVGMVQAVSTSLVVITLISSAGFIAHLSLSQSIDWKNLMWVAGSGLFGMWLGQSFSHKIAGEKLQKIFAVSLMIVSIVFLTKLI